ncbi:Hypothetical predicted protein [Paramuricea clavata]|uniref:DUF5641 domain-containing protein n=1 Tax=Paramuricea clavata TaxID=317549 RepID=A0A6S7GJM3_PARCT|nr:Hypothetical predicted protein [Paramuricea clavata]
MVIVQGEGIKIPRLIWKLVRVESLRKSNDGRVRGAVVKTAKEDGLRCYDRPIKKLYPLEMNYESNETESRTDQEPEIAPVRRCIHASRIYCRMFGFFIVITCYFNCRTC